MASNAWDSKGGVDFKKASSNVNILSNSLANDEAKVVENDFEVATIPNSEMSIDALKSVLTGSTISQKVGMINVLDYVNASATLTCPSNYLSDDCKNNNYLYNMFGTTNSTWTINGDGTSIWYINNSGILSLAPSSDNKQIYPVIKLSSNVYITNTANGTGNSSNPFILK
jgi:hypothetical protein